jgi:hypothetical protein
MWVIGGEVVGGVGGFEAVGAVQLATAPAPAPRVGGVLALERLFGV